MALERGTTPLRSTPGTEPRVSLQPLVSPVRFLPFTEYLQAYTALPKAVERADFFRYLVILRHGGMYADTDVECMMPIDTWSQVR
jgi:hypothetical protein